MEESTTYQAILEEGTVRGLRRIILLQGHKRFQGTPRSVKTNIEAITSLPRLRKLSLRLLDVMSWQELLALPEPARRSTQRKPKT